MQQFIDTYDFAGKKAIARNVAFIDELACDGLDGVVGDGKADALD